MATYVVRVWVPDRPGALGAVASRIGAVRGDLVGVDILERGADYFLYNVLDTLVDRYFPILETLDDRIDELEDRIVKAPRQDLLDEIFRNFCIGK